MLMSEVSLPFSPSLSLSPSSSPPPPPPPLSLSGRKSGSIADPMVWPMLYLSGQAMILSALNVIYSKRLPKSTQRDPLTQRSGLSHKHLSLPLSAWWRAHTAIRTSVDTRFYARMYKERACTQAHKKTPHTCTFLSTASAQLWQPQHNVRVHRQGHTGAGRCPREASPYVTFTTRDILFPAGLDLIHGLKVACEVRGQISEQHTVIMRLSSLHWLCTVNTTRKPGCLLRYSVTSHGTPFNFGHLSSLCSSQSFCKLVWMRCVVRHGEALVVLCCHRFYAEDNMRNKPCHTSEAPHSYMEPLFGNCYCLKEQYLSNVTGETRLL